MGGTTEATNDYSICCVKPAHNRPHMRLCLYTSMFYVASAYIYITHVRAGPRAKI